MNEWAFLFLFGNDTHNRWIKEEMETGRERERDEEKSRFAVTANNLNGTKAHTT